MQRLILPTLQNWSCHNCGGCCREHAIVVTTDEQQRILAQQWTSADDIPSPPFVKMGSRWRLRTRADGACVFLNDKGLCKIHAKFGEPTKPLACRIYPYAFHPAGDDVVLGLRFSCPSVIANRGRTLPDQFTDLRQLQKLVVPPSASQHLPPLVAGQQRLTWEETLSMAEGVAEVLRDPSVPIALRLVRAEFVARMIGQANFDKIRGERVAELVQILSHNAPTETPAQLDQIPLPGTLARTQFRLIVAQYARKDTFGQHTQGLRYRLRMMMAGLTLTRGRGHTPAMQENLPRVPFASLDQPASLSEPERFDELWTRYFIVKITSLHFTGAAFYDLPFAEGLQRLWMIFPITLYLARWIALGEKSPQINHDHLALALALADHHHGSNPALALSNFRTRANWIIQNNALPQLIRWQTPA